MNSFIQRHGAAVIGILHGFDRLRLRGTKRLLCHVGGMLNFLWQAQVLLKDFKTYALQTTAALRHATEQTAQQAERPLLYLPSSSASKEDEARAIAERDGVRQGLVCVLSSVEPCWSYEIYRNRTSKELELRGGLRKCLHYYHYFLDPELGWLHARLQTWFPFTMHVCLNGREWLARQMQAASIGYVRRDNCFVEVADVERAQGLLDAQLRTDWPTLLNRIARQVNPIEAQCFGAHPVPYYWSADQSEWASDVLFRSAADLARVYPRLVQHGLLHLHSGDVMRFFGKQLGSPGERFGRFKTEVISDLKERLEGVRVKHRVNDNSVKMYDKQGSVLRVETTINDAHDLKVYRAKEGDEDGPKQWRYLRKGIADLHRRAAVSQKANERYLETLAAVEDTTPLAELTAELCQPVRWQGKRVRALNPLAADDAALLAAVSRGEFTLNGFRNSDLRPLLFGAQQVDSVQQRRQSAAVTRKLRMLRAHRLIRKVPKTHRYVLSDYGRRAITALLAARQADAAKLTAAA